MKTDIFKKERIGNLRDAKEFVLKKEYVSTQRNEQMLLKSLVR